MDIVISAVASELVSRFISFLSMKYSSKACLKKNLEMLQHLLLRVHTVVEEAEGRYIANSRMLSQLKALREAMFQGYDVFDTYMPLEKFGEEEEDNPLRVPTVLPIIGGCRVGKKTLVWNICCDDRIRSYYSSIVHFSGDEIQKIDNDKFKRVRTLVTIEFVSDVGDEEWLKFYSFVALTGKGSKVIIISKLEELTRLGTVHPIRINSLSREEYSYLFKVLAFGSANPMDHPRLALVGKELATVFQGSLVMLNVYASVLRTNLNVQFWTRVLELFRVMIYKNLAIFGEHPKSLLEKDGTSVDITGFSLSSLSDTSFRLVLLTTETEASKGGLPTMGFGDIIAGSVILPKKFKLVWESRLPPYTVICANCTAEKPQQPLSPRKKRRRLCVSFRPQ
ncbi:uncharacterized protein LOC133907956 [Phragmites australis]|uniref:uncharacterized protein LOC133907956 n=1 Tax=Phragmites australis TaxID=29695 RepID=UPI002D784615|nr:uncharacterized protein LOC133907956 [Phragmites australis]